MTKPTSLSPTFPKVDFQCDTLTLRYKLDPNTQCVSFSMFPTQRSADLVDKRKVAPLHPSQEKDATPWALYEGDSKPDSLVHLHLRGEILPKGFIAGQSMRDSGSTQTLRFLDQEVQSDDHGRKILTRLSHPAGLILLHEITWKKGFPGVICQTGIQHDGSEAVVLEHLSSFSLGGLSPFSMNDMPHRGRVHRFRSAWSLEGRHEAASLEDLHLERTWAGYGHVNLRFGQTGSMPVRGFFPFVGFEDSDAGVLWGAQLAWHGSWQMEVHRRDDPIALAGSHADFDFGQWSKTLNPGESFSAPPALLSCAEGDIDNLCRNLVLTQDLLAYPEPADELHMPMIFNEWCSTWGHPSHENVSATAARLQETPTRIFVIDDGWAKRPPEASIQVNGDWVVNTDKFPGGLAPTTAAIRNAGLTPGVWFEFEVTNRGNPSFTLSDHQLKRHGQVIQVGDRRFWDFRDPWTFDYLREKVISLLRDNDFGYMKVDYNDSIGIGCDVPDDPNAGLGEGLRQHLLRVRDFFLEIRRELPELLIENCSSGGHRLEPGMVGLTSMSSFSDAHECVEIPIIAANLLRLIPARKNQIWVVLRPTDSPQRLQYGFAATFMGRMAVSGDLTALSPAQQEVMDRSQAFYQEVHSVIRDGVPRLHRSETGSSYRYPSGRQAVSFHFPDEGRLLVITHSFDSPPDTPQVIPIPEGNWILDRQLSETEFSLREGILTLPPAASFSANAFLLHAT